MTSFDVASDDLVRDWIYTRFSPSWNLMFKAVKGRNEVCELIVLVSEMKGLAGSN